MILWFLVLGLVSFFAYYIGKRKAISYSRHLKTNNRPHSLPFYHGSFVASWVLIPVLLVLLALTIFGTSLTDRLTVLFMPDSYIKDIGISRLELVRKTRDILGSGLVIKQPVVLQTSLLIKQVSQGIKWSGIVFVIFLGSGLGFWSFSRINENFRARVFVERYLLGLLIFCSVIAIATTAGIVLSLFWESLKFFSHVNPFDFLFGTQWSPQTALREDQIGQQGAFGAVPLFYGTALITLIAMFVAGPVGLFSAIYLSEYAGSGRRKYIKPVLEILAGIPTVVYGFFAALTVAPVIRNLAESVGMEASSRNALAAGIVMGLMIVPFVSSLSDDIIHAVPQSLRDGSYALGSTKSETIKGVVFPAALPGIVGALLLAVSRAVGETMIVVMAAGQAANITANPLESVTTITVQIVSLITGDDAFDSPKTLSAFALGLVLFFMTLVLNIIALQIVRKYREKYD